MYLIALGANLPSSAGPPLETLAAALGMLEDFGLAVLRRSAWYRTPAFPPSAGPPFVNAAAALTAPMAPEAVLEALHRAERQLGRDRGRRWAPRSCDLDLLACGDLVLPDAATVAAWMSRVPEAQDGPAPAQLILPHPRMHERGFVLRPLADIAPDWIHPLLGRTVQSLLAGLPAEAIAGIDRL